MNAQAPQSDASVQNLSQFRLPRNFRGRSAITVQIWWLFQALLFHTSPQFLYSWRRFLLRLFGAKIGSHVLIRPSARITFPWKVEIGDYSWIGDRAELYSLGPINIGKNVVISQDCYICTGSHDRRDSNFAISAEPIVIEDEVWLASQVFVGPGVHVGQGAVVGVRSLVLSDIQPMSFAAGQPARVTGARR